MKTMFCASFQGNITYKFIVYFGTKVDFHFLNVLQKSRSEANLAVSAFYLRKEKDDEKKILEDKDLEVLGSPIIKYGDSTVIVQHVETGLWLSYKVP